MIGILKCFIIIFFSILMKEIICKIIAKLAKNYFYDDSYTKGKIYDAFIKYKKNIYSGLLSFLIFILALLNGYSILYAILYVIVANLLIFLYKRVMEETTKKQVLQDLLNVCECLRVQLSSEISLGVALRNLAELCKNKEFSTLLKNIYLEYELDKFTITTAGKQLEKRFNYSEIKMFISAIKQQNQHTSMLELIDNLIDILREEYIEFLEDDTKNKMAIMTLGVFIIVINVAALGIYPVLVETFTAINTMFY